VDNAKIYNQNRTGNGISVLIIDEDGDQSTVTNRIRIGEKQKNIIIGLDKGISIDCGANTVIGSITNNNIYDVNVGIFLEDPLTNSNIEISKNNIGDPSGLLADNGIVYEQNQGLNSPFGSLNIKENNIYFGYKGIYLYGAASNRLNIDVRDNREIVYSRATPLVELSVAAIHSVWTSGTSASDLKIRRNIISSLNVQNPYTFGILCEGVQGSSYSIEGNGITGYDLQTVERPRVDVPVPISSGIQTINAPNGQIQNNLCTSTDNANQSCGIRMEDCPNTNLSCNRISGCFTGYVVKGQCQGIWTNNVLNLPTYAGLILHDGIIGPQVTNGASNCNLFKYLLPPSPTLFGTRSISSNGNFSQFTTSGYSNSGFDDLIHARTSDNPVGGIIMDNLPGNQPANPGQNCTVDLLPWPYFINSRTAELFKWLDPDLNFGEYDVQEKYMYSQYLFSVLDNDLALRNSDDFVRSFFDYHFNGNIGKLYKVDKESENSNYQLAKALNEGIVPLNEIETTHQIINRIKLEALIRKRSELKQSNGTNTHDTTHQAYEQINTELLLPNEYSTVVEKSVLCPRRYGRSVYQARELRSLQENVIRNYVNDCVTPILPKLSGTQANDNITLYPNPAKNWITIHSSIESENMNVKFVDVLGREVKSLSLSSQTNLNIDIQDLIEGIYLVQIFDGTNILFSDKLVVVR